MTKYYTMESVRALIAGKYDVRSAVEEPVPIPSWNRYPCSRITLCERRGNSQCIGYVSIFINMEKIKWLFLEISFFRSKQRAFIRANALQTQKLFELGIIPDEGILVIEEF